jgi:uncharacterized protein YvpB
MRKACRILMGKPKEKKQLGTLNVDGYESIKMEKMGCEGVDWVNLAQYKNKRRTLVNTVMNFGVT